MTTGNSSSLTPVQQLENKPFYIGKYWFTLEDVQSMVGPGWSELLKDLTDKLFALGWDGGLSQVKEKFGTLRFYWNNNIEGIFGEIAEDVVSEAEAQSGQVCETCGKYGKVRGNGWLSCRCDECWEREGHESK